VNRSGDDPSRVRRVLERKRKGIDLIWRRRFISAQLILRAKRYMRLLFFTFFMHFYFFLCNKYARHDMNMAIITSHKMQNKTVNIDVRNNIASMQLLTAQ